MRPKHLVGFYIASSLKQKTMGEHIVSLAHIIPITSQPVFTFSPYCCMLTTEVINTIL